MDVETVSVEQAAPCRIIAFPPARRTPLVERTARAILCQTTVEKADRLRHSLAAKLFAGMERIGIDEGEQDERVGAFFNAVELELLMLEDELLYAAPE